MTDAQRSAVDGFLLIPMSQLGEVQFQMYPVWSEFYDSEEVEEIVNWGVSRDWLLKELGRLHAGDEHCAYPVLLLESLPQRMRLYVRAYFETHEGRRLNGFVMNDDAYCIGIFYGGRKFKADL